MATITPGTVIPCANAWCRTSTKTHRSTFAKRRCDQSGHSAAMEVNANAIAPLKPLRDGGAHLGSSRKRGRVSYNDLHDAHLEGATVENVDLDEAQGANFTEAAFANVAFTAGILGATFAKARGHQVRIDYGMAGSDFDGVGLSELAVTGEARVDDCSFVGARLNDSKWGSALDISNSSFRWASLRRAKFDGHVKFENCDLMGCDLSNSEFVGDPEGEPTFVQCEIDMTNFSGIDLRSTHFSGIDLKGRIYFIDSDTLPPQGIGTISPTDFGRTFMTKAMTEEQFAEYTGVLGASEWEVRSALERLSPAFIPVFDGGRVGERGELLRRAILGEDVDVLASVQSEVWAQSAERNSLLVTSPDDAFA